MSNRFARADARDDLFSSYNRSTSPSKSKQKPRSPYAPSPGSSSPGYAYAYGYTSSPAGGPSLYPGERSGGGGGGYGVHGGAAGKTRGGYSSAAVLDELESQNENEHVGILTSKVRQLKDLTHLIGDEIRDSTSLAEKMNDQFENSRLRLRGTMNRMLRMAQKTGVGWRVWLAFFAAVILLFWWVWLG
ncbi:protein transport protein bet1 [Pleosporales sp. CAS-2024a]